jgi:tetratricopeptide (TPR) repeat protein
MIQPLNRLPLIALLAVLAHPAFAAQPKSLPADGGAERVRCLSKAQASPDFALQDAIAWEKRGGGADARLCQALALLGQGEFQQAAERIEKVIPELKGSGPGPLSGLWDRAAWAWLQVHEESRALAAYGEALRLKPTDPDLWIDRATALAAMERYWDAVKDLDKTIEIAPQRADAFALRAAALNQLSRRTEAEADLGRSLAIDPQQPDALLLRGNLRMARGDQDGARADWQQILDSHGDSDQAKAAAANLELLAKQPRERKAGDKKR